jgi:transcriptional regulator with XRE-family HTH domain
MEQVARRLRLCVLQSERTVREIAEAIGQSTSTVYRWMDGSAVPSALGLARLCRVLGVSADWLLGLEDYFRGEDTTR